MSDPKYEVELHYAVGMASRTIALLWALDSLGKGKWPIPLPLFHRILFGRSEFLQM